MADSPVEAQAVRKILVVGSGPAGMTAAIALAQADVHCDVVEVENVLRPAGVGLLLQSPALRALETLGLMAEAVSRGWRHDSLDLTTPDGVTVADSPLNNVNGADDPPAVAMSRMTLHEILAERLGAEGVAIRLGTTVKSLDQNPERVHIEFSDGTSESYDLVIGAEGLHSPLRTMILPGSLTPQENGQVIWRVGLHRPPSLDHYMIMLGANRRIGLVPLSDERFYLWMLEPAEDDVLILRDDAAERLSERLAEFRGPVPDFLDQVPSSDVDVRTLTSLIVPPPWHVGRTLLIGDAVHTTTPHLAFGIGLAIEDSIVLADLIRTGVSPLELGAKLTERRYERCRLVVENSLQLGRWELAPDTPGANGPGLFAESTALLAQQI